MKRYLFLFMLLFIPTVIAYDAVITVTGTLTSYKNVPITGYGARMELYDALPLANPIDDTGDPSPQTPFSSFTRFVQLAPGTTYYLTVEFVGGLCTTLGPHDANWVSHPNNCNHDACSPPRGGGCWGFCTATQEHNFRKNVMAYNACNAWDKWGTSARGVICDEIPDVSTESCNGARLDPKNPVSPTTTQPGFSSGSIIFGADENNRIEFTAP